MYKDSKRSGIQIRRKEIITLVLILIIEGIFVFINSSVLSDLYAQRVKETLKQDTIFVKLLAKDYPHEKYKDIFENSDLRFTLINREGKVEFDSKNISREEYMDNHLQRKEVQEALKSGEGFDIRHSKTMGETFAYYTTTFKNNYGEEFVIRTSSDYEGVQSEIHKFLAIQIGFFIILNFAIHLFYKIYIKRDFYKKIGKMKDFLEKGENGNTNFLKEEKWFFEFWLVLKEWQKKNLENISRLDKERKTLSLIMESIDIFIGLIDKDGRFVVKNGVLDEIIDYRRDRYIEALKYIEIIDVIKKGIAGNTELSEEVYIQSIKRYFAVTVKKLEFSSEVLLTIKDITPSKQASEVQRTFISNVSHELKTPLTNIKGYLIALEDAPDTMKKRFLTVIKENVIKLENIVSDFLNISKIESSAILNREEVEASALINSLNAALEMIVKNKNADISYDVELKNGKTTLKIDKERVITVLKNLIENGILYNENSPIIEVDIKELEDRYTFTVTDNGIGIPIDEQYKIFDRFYRVDKARTSNLGGTGLGLAIVKSIVEQCGGKITVKSVEKSGTVFELYIMK
ncbi:Sensor histidine kinase RcsC [Fusobacterium sp. DD29]|uniref:sensor histidine kinase n=1 Tax=unclassified Fusobacterium TaxID=2648384 RepID=UPI001B8BF6E3|nr:MULTISPECIES: ATP-binding protein [unclassified Fusobacterium]MBR8701380.1 Sensor histidine kinase RcsC [Fusobacterium sp. DD45]MBR8711148.1 Sensor histidine kinase RcsC [Fusobacterium sp. DD28]MBR8749901.1 Sensor histidine kinase RcsC [Fusobacterium sp. DD29]MBR8751697.1 Sensor histidine kinase RcsC [Fusobacterium sp. DD26]MBR8762155.1 Sensor histidine kinase RcsC [Fusobacterium sp. DD25]